MSDEDIALDEKRIFGDERDVTDVYVASTMGLAHLAVAADRAGQINLLFHGTIRDVAGGADYLLVATEGDVFVGTDGPSAVADLDETDFGTAEAVGVGDDRLVAASPDGQVSRLAGDDWVTVGTLEGPHRADGPFVAGEGGVVRVEPDRDSLTSLSLDGTPDVRDVAAGGPYAATDEGLYRLDDGEWTLEREEPCERVSAGGDEAHLVADGDLYERVGDEWFPCHLPVEGAIADVAYGEVPYAVTVDGTFLVDADPDSTADGGSAGWRHRSLGLPDVSAVAIP